jgi:hypothetical protein
VSTLLILGAVPAAAQDVTGSAARGAGPNDVNFQVTNGSGGPFIAADFVLQAPVVSVGAVSGATGSCSVNSSSQEQVNCFFEPSNPWNAGGTITFGLQTSTRLPDGALTNVFACGIPCDPNMKRGPFGITLAPEPDADRGVELSLGRTFLEDILDDGIVVKSVPQANLWLHAEMTNHGPEPSEASDQGLLVGIAGGAPGTNRERIKRTNLICNELADPFGGLLDPATCDLPALPKDGQGSVIYGVLITQPGALAVEARLVPDQNTSNDIARYTDELVQMPESAGGRLINLRRFDIFGGVAPGAERVYVSVAQEQGGAKAGAAAAGCRWLTSVRVRFRREGGRRCNEPAVLTARVKRGRWRLRLKKNLPAGRYVMMTRAQTPDGLVERSVHTKLGNLKRFRVKP